VVPSTPIVAKPLHQFIERRRRDRGNAARAGDHGDIRRLRTFIERDDAGDESGIVGEVDVMRSRCDRRPDGSIGIFTIGLKRSRRVDYDRCSEPCDFAKDVAVAIDAQRCSTVLAAVCRRLVQRASGDKDFGLCLLDEPPRQPSPKDSVAAEYEYFSQ